MSSTQFDVSRLQAEFVQASSFFMPVNLERVAAPVADFPMEEAAPVAALRDFSNETLQAELKARILANPVWAKLYRNKKLSVGLVDMQEETAPRFATLNGRHMMYAASLPKIAVLAAAQDAIERGELKETEEIRRDMRLMIAKSNNAATTRMIDRVGFENIERTMTSPELKLYDPEFGGGLWVGKRYAAGGRRYPDPIKGISHAATAEQVCRYFYLLANGRLISETASSAMMSYLVNPELHHKFVNTLDRIAPNATVYRKSGSWSVFHADVAMVQGPERNYIMTALVEDPEGEQICRELAEVLDELARVRS
ncbi:serine hydrolase [Lewinella sp. W8]|uniref:serine hydrolase n=1 Tax=Lewinella sp. W8 TaxID=2528208 RepID=UPI0020A64484|nr:serine hydrolase [Lewinella sp. W8]